LGWQRAVVRGTPARLAERLKGVAPASLVARVDEKWSIQENVGHLLDLEALWASRLGELLAGVSVLKAADLENRMTHEADHNARPLGALLQEFRGARGDFVARLEAVPEGALARSALHPRLRQPMNISDLCFFVAEHDDHHLARITEALRAGR
jgi:uncharacterized damage-inducible protein DinB